MLTTKQLEKMIEDATITNDTIFGIVMEKGDNCLRLLREILPELNIQTVHFETHSRQKTQKTNDIFKSSVLDVLAEDESGRQYDIEMQVEKRPSMGKRVRYYQSKMDETTLLKGHDYGELKATYIIFLCTYDPFNQDLRRYDFQYRCTQKLDLKLNTGSKVIFLNSVGKQGEVSTHMQSFFELMNGKIKTRNKFIDQISYDVELLKRDPKWRHDFMDMKMRLADERYAGKREALQAGARRMVLAFKELGLSSDEISQKLTKFYHDDLSAQEIRDIINKA